MQDSAVFTKAYAQLNTAQKLAVDTVEGPVLVIAGPGTGKTHILTLRIANILRLTQAKPTNILVLTFTESAARTVRTRLAGLVGEATARDVATFTFHSFCDYILKEYPDYFPSWGGKRLAGDVETTLLWRAVLEHEEIVHLRLPKAPYFYLRELESLYNNLSRERVTLDHYRAWAKEEEEAIKTDTANYYTRDSTHGKKGDFKPEGVKKLERLEKVYEACRLFEAYEARKEAEGVYDFSDVLRGVVDTLQNDEALRASLQEQFQYVLADEHQDANAYQHALLDSFAFDDHPNLFVVGDEKQAIFRFQGADSTHFREFLDHYPRTTLVTLTESFRSLDGILQAAHSTALSHIPASHGVHEPLFATRTGVATLSLLIAPDPLAERDQVAGLVESALNEGVLPHEIAVISARNASVTSFAEHLAGKGIPTLRAGDVSLSSRPLIRSLLVLMRAVANPIDSASLRECILAPWWGEGIVERATFLARTRDRELLSELSHTFPKMAETITTLQASALHLAPLEIFSELLLSSGARGYALGHGEHLEDVALVRKLYGYLEEIVARDTSVRFKDAVEQLNQAQEHGLNWVKSSTLTREGFVTVITAHKVKGMEFERVFIVGLTENEWEKGKVSAKIPSLIDMAKSADDAAKQFYVALTRAKDQVTLSYARETLEGRERKPSLFIPQGLTPLTPAYDPLPKLHRETDAPELVRLLTKEYLEGEGLSPSALSEYLESPATFFARRVLHLKEPEQARMLIGTAVHEGIAQALREGGTESSAHAALHAAFHRSLMPRTSAYTQAMEDATHRLESFLEARHTLGRAQVVEQTYKVQRQFGTDLVNLSGKVDAVLEQEGNLRIVDFKTSSSVRGKEEDFQLQLSFYDFLLRENRETPKGASIIQIRPDGIEEFPILITDALRQVFLDTLNDVIPEMLSGKWRAPAEASAYDDLLRLFA